MAGLDGSSARDIAAGGLGLHVPPLWSKRYSLVAVNARTLYIGGNDMDDCKARKYVGTSAFVLPLVSEWLDALQQVRFEQEKNDYAKRCLESLRVLQQLVFEIIENEPVNDDASVSHR
jgi:hypothetical protein